MSLDDEVALDLGCKRCARIYLAIFRNEGVSWMDKIIRDTKMRPKAVHRHLKRLLALKLVATEEATLYKIAKEIDSVKKVRTCENTDCEGCGKVYLALLRNGGVGWVKQIMRDAKMRRHNVKTHLQHLLDLVLIEETVLGMYRIRKQC